MISKAGGWVLGLEKMEAIWLHICEARLSIEASPASMAAEFLGYSVNRELEDSLCLTDCSCRTFTSSHL